MRIVSVMRKVCLVLAVLPSVVMAVEPSVSALVPYGVRRGGETEVVFRGARLGDAEQLLFYEPGIETKKIEKVDDNACKATLLVGPDCPLGVKGVRVRTATGISNLMLLSVGALPVVEEKEPNNEFSTPQPIEMNYTVHGLVQNEDVDYFVVEARKGERLTAEIEGVRLGMTFFDPYLAILNTERFELSRSDDAALCRQDGVCSILVPQDGKYIIEVRETSYGGNGASNYRLHVGSFPRPTAVMPAGGRPGETVEFTYLGDPTGPFSEKVTLPSQVASPEFELFAQDAKGMAPSPNLVRVVDLPNFIEAEPNDAAAQATAASGPGALNGVIQQPGDVDLYKISAKKGEQYDVRVHAR
ncbi:MAG: PPC domain-containing protein, partial [Pirellulaceae bacterium]